MVTSRLLITAAFARGMSNFKTVPNRPAVTADTCVYHALPHGLRDGLRQRVVPGLYVDTTGVHATKRKALAAHQSQQAWLDASQGMNSYLLAMEDMSLEVGKMSGRFKHAEGWSRHLHLGFSGVDNDPLTEALTKKCMINQDYESRLNSGYESGSPMTASKTTSDPL